jgi:hypothetical protein
MSWKCPACQTAIAHDPAATPRLANAVYRCHVCRLELVVDPFSGKLTLAPLDSRERTEAEKKFPI